MCGIVGIWNLDSQAVDLDALRRATTAIRLPQLPANAQAQQNGQHARRSLALFYKAKLDEPMFVLRQLKLEAARNLSRTISTLNLDRASAGRIKAAAAGMTPNTNDRALLKVLDQINPELSLDQRKALLRKTVELRGQ